jgi:hypothetical protein
MVRNSASNTRRVPVDHNMFASRSGGLTIVGPDERIWQSDLKSDNLVPVDRAVALATGMVPALDPQDYVDQIRMGSNRTLYQSVLNSSGVANWEAITDLHPDMSNGFKLPKKVENDAILEESTLDDDGIILSQFVGSYASYWRMREERQAHEFKRFQAKVDRRTNIIKATRNDLKDVSARKTYDAGTARLKKMKAAAEKSKKAAMKSEKSNSAATAPK